MGAKAGNPKGWARALGFRLTGLSAYRLSVNECLTLLAQRQCQRSTCAVSKGLNGLPTVRKPGLPTVRQRALDLLKIWIRTARKYAQTRER